MLKQHDVYDPVCALSVLGVLISASWLYHTDLNQLVSVALLFKSPQESFEGQKTCMAQLVECACMHRCDCSQGTKEGALQTIQCEWQCCKTNARLVMLVKQSSCCCKSAFSVATLL